MRSVLADLRFALRQLRRSPGFALTAILTLALGIGATTAIFTLVNQVMLRSLPVPHSEQLYKVGKELQCCDSSSLQNDWSLFSFDLYDYMRRQTTGTAGLVAVQAGQTTTSVRRAGDPAAAQPLDVRFVSGNYFAVLGVKPYLGRMLRDSDDRQGAAPVVVVSYTLWQNKFAADPRLVGSTLMLSGHPVTVVGISAAGFLGERITTDPPGLWLPVTQEPVVESDRSLAQIPAEHWLDVMVRIENPSQRNATQLALQGALRQWIAAHRDLFPRSTPQDFARQTTELAPAGDGINDLRDEYESSLKLLLMVAGFVLLIACANLANLMLVRGMARRQELAVRTALGAQRARLVRQMLVEALLLSLAGGAAALLVAYAGTRGILALAMRGAEFTPLDASPSLPVLGFALLVSLVTGVLFGTAPAWIASRANPVDALRGANRGSTGDQGSLPQKSLVVLQAALSLALLSTAGLLITSLRHLEHQDFHFETQGRLVVFTDLQAAGYTPDRLAGLYQRFDGALTHLPGIESFAYASYSPMTHNNTQGSVYFPGVAPGSHQSISASYSSISPGYFHTLGTKVLAGREIDEHDTATSPHVAVVNQLFVQRFLQGKQPIGRHFGPDPQMPGLFEIVGVVEDTKYTHPNRPQRPMYFTPITQSVAYTKPEDISSEQFTHYAINLVAHYQGDENAAANAIRQALKQINPNIPILSMRSYRDELGQNFTREELVVRLTTLFGLLALVLAAIGLYGVTAYGVARRTSEIGIRMALGASRGGVLAMIVRAALLQALVGLALGLPLAFAVSRLLQHTLYQTGSFQPLVLAAVSALLLAAAFIAAIIPARRAASIDPMQALRTE